MTGTTTKERPILMSGPMALAAHNGTKTQTRRPVKPAVPESHGICRKLDSFTGDIGRMFLSEVDEEGHIIPGKTSACARWSPFGKTGEKLWVRETFAIVNMYGVLCDNEHAKTRQHKMTTIYAADEGPMRYYDSADELIEIPESRIKWRPSIHMPRWASRTTLEIVNVRVERVQDIGIDDAKGEGVSEYGHEFRAEPWFGSDDIYRNCTTVENFSRLWNFLYAESFPWASNPWVWVYEFKKVTT